MNDSPQTSARLGPAPALERVGYAFLCSFLFAIPWEEAPQLGGYPIGRWLGLVTLGIALLRLAANWQRRKLSAVHCLMVSFVALSALSLLWTVDWDNTLTRIGTYFQLLMVVWLIWELAVTESRILGLIRSYVLGIFLAAAFTIYNFATGTTSAQLSAAQGVEKWDENRFSITGVNENDLGLMLAMCIPMMIYLAIRADRKRLAPLFYWAGLVTCIAAILLTGSRGALVSAAIGMIMLPLTLSRLPRLQKVTAAIACVIVVAGGIWFLPKGIWERFLGLSAELTSGTLTHRLPIWAAGLAVFREHPFFGIGSGAYPAAVLRMIDVPYVAHNTFLSILVELGIAGALIVAGLAAGLVYSALRMRYLERCLWLTVLSSWAVGVMALTWEYRKPTWVMFGLLAAHAYSRRVKQSVHIARARIPVSPIRVSRVSDQPLTVH
jgi:hypothetical protein